MKEFEDYLTMEHMRYWSMNSTYTAKQQKEKIDALIYSGEYIASEKKDGNLIRAVCGEDTCILQTRGISKKTGTYGEIQNKVFFANDISKAFENITVFLGEVYMDNGVDKDVGSILRCLDSKAIARQKEDSSKILKYYIFDVLCYEGLDLSNSPIIERIKYLPKIVNKINNPLVSYAKYYEVKPENFYEKLEAIFSKGGEGMVLYKKTMTPVEGRTPAWQTVKVKQTLGQDADCFIYETRPPKREYEGKEIQNWNYWVNSKTDEKLEGNHYAEYVNGGTVVPVTKPYYNEWPGSIACAVLDNGEPRVLCYCSNLTDEFCCELRDNWEEYYMHPIRVQGMLVSETINKDGSVNYSIRHPKFMGLRDDIAIEDCTFEKIIGEK